MTSIIRYTAPEAKYHNGKRMVSREQLKPYLPSNVAPVLITTAPEVSTPELVPTTPSKSSWPQTLLQATVVQTAVALIKDIVQYLF